MKRHPGMIETCAPARRPVPVDTGIFREVSEWTRDDRHREATIHAASLMRSRCERAWQGSARVLAALLGKAIGTTGAGEDDVTTLRRCSSRLLVAAARMTGDGEGRRKLGETCSMHGGPSRCSGAAAGMTVRGLLGAAARCGGEISGCYEPRRTRCPAPDTV